MARTCETPIWRSLDGTRKVKRLSEAYSRERGRVAEVFREIDRDIDQRAVQWFERDPEHWEPLGVQEGETDAGTVDTGVVHAPVGAVDDREESGLGGLT